MASRLYPGFGTGKGVFDERFDCRSFASVGRSDMEAGDKLFLPASAFKEISRLKLPFPLTFKVQNERTKPTNVVPSKDGKQPPAPPEQFAGVLEFSAPDGVAYLPTWMLQNLKVRDGGKAQFTTVRDLPRGTYAKLQPYSQAFVDLAAAVGPRDLLEVALRNYSALSQGERIMIDVADEKYFVDVIEVKPGKAISIYGNVDLEVDFAPVKGSVDDVNEAKAKAAESGTKEDKAAAAAKIAAAEAAEVKAANNAVLNAKKALMSAAGGGGGVLSSSTAVAAANVLSEGGVAKKTPLTPIKSPNTKASGSAGSPALQNSTSTGPISPSRSSTLSPSSSSSSAAKPSLLKQLAEKVSASPTLPSLLKSGGGKGGVKSPGGVLSPDIFNMPMAFFEEYHGVRSDGVNLTSSFNTASSLPPSSPILLPTATSPGRSATLGSSSGRGQASTLNPPSNSNPVAVLDAPAPKPDAKALAKMREERAKAALARMAALAQTAALGSEGKNDDDDSRSESKHSGGNSAPSTPQRSKPVAAVPARAPAALAPPPEKRAPLLHGGEGGGGKEDDLDVKPTPRSPISSALVEADDDGISPTRRCRFCLQDVPRNAFDLHSARCARNSSYHKTVCTVCGSHMYVKDLEKHIHCSLGCGSLLEVDAAAGSIAATGSTDISSSSSASLNVSQLIAAAAALHAQVCPKRLSSCECGFSCAFESLDSHRLQCPSAKSPCKYCKVIFKKSALQAHEDKCGSRTMACEICSRLVVVRNMAAHVRDGTCPGPAAAAAVPPVLPTSSSSTTSETVGQARSVAEAALPSATPSTANPSSSAAPAGSLVARKLLAAKKLSSETSTDSKDTEDGSRESSKTTTTTTRKSTASSSTAPLVSARPSTREDPLFKAAIAESMKTAAAEKSPTKGKAIPSGSAKQPASGRPPSVQGKDSGAKSSSGGGGGGGDEKKTMSRRSVASEFAFPCPHCNKQQNDYEALQVHVFTECAKAGIVPQSGKSSSKKNG